METNEQAIIELARQRGAIAAADLAAAGIAREYLPRMARKGLMQRIARGRYRLPDTEVTENHDLALFAAQVPNGVITLLSALAFHGIGTQIPHELWVAVKARSRAPALTYPPLRYHYYSGAAYELGIEQHFIEGVVVKVYSPAKTVVDCFRLRSKVGLDVALEALKEGWQAKRFSVDELMTIATACRIANVIRPHFEMLVA
ncbi:MAG: AbiEi antitoxin N-terminal domain-containing protein [Pseudomonadota bacterium]